MPLLALEPFLYPENLLASSERPPEQTERWWVLHTKPRVEKSLARQCVARELSFYLPLHHKKWRNGGRVQQSHVPLFPGYVFLHGDESARQVAFETNLVAYAIPVVQQQQLHDDLFRLHRFIDSGTAVTAEDRLQTGDPVRIVHGPLTGMEGKVLRREKNCRFFIEIRFLQRGVSAEIESWMIQAL